jgi:hypothetical protein
VGQAESGAFARFLGGEKRIEDARLNGRRNAWTVVFNLHDGPRRLAPGANRELAFAVHRVGGVIENVRPYLVQFACRRQ